MTPETRQTLKETAVVATVGITAGYGIAQGIIKLLGYLKLNTTGEATVICLAALGAVGVLGYAGYSWDIRTMNNRPGSRHRVDFATGVDDSTYSGNNHLTFDSSTDDSSDSDDNSRLTFS